MVKIDLITGFLGSGKTDVFEKYAKRLIGAGAEYGILENDFGAVNVDMMLLQELEGEQCELEMISGGCDPETHRRRFRTKLIAMGMCGYDRVLVEPSGIYDMDEFFDVLHEEPLDQWYEIGNVIAVVERAAGGRAFAGGGVPAGVASGKCRLYDFKQVRHGDRGAAAEYNRASEAVAYSARLQAAGGSENFVRGRRTAPRSGVCRDSLLRLLYRKL